MPNLTVAENIFLGRENRFLRFGVINWKKMNEAARRRIEQLGYDIDPKALTASIPFSERQMVEIARVISLEDELHYKPIIILDEPTTALSGEEIERLFQIMKNLAEIKYSIIFISHRLEEILDITRNIVVLKDGRNVGYLKTGETTPARLQTDDGWAGNSRRSSIMNLGRPNRKATWCSKSRDLAGTVRTGC